jgi:hypothetical protein
MKPSTAGMLAAMIGFLAILVHAGITFMTLLGTGLASTPETPVPESAETLWGIALWGTLVAGIALVLLMMFWTKPVATFYALTWLALVGCYQAGWLVDAGRDRMSPTGFLILEAALPLAGVAIALYGVWTYRNSLTEQAETT